jgi:isopenicillin N synthase-like dioxygenase
MSEHMSPSIDLPIIDLSLFWSAHASTTADHKLVAQRLVGACEQFGMFYVTLGDRFSQMCAPAFKAANTLFSLPQYVKETIVPDKPVTSAVRGYVSAGAESGGVLLERKETFCYAAEPAAVSASSGNALQAPNVWPPDGTPAAEATKVALEKFLVNAALVAAAVCRVLALALDDRDLVRSCEAGNSISLVRCFHYFMNEEHLGGTGSNQHTDWGLLTVIAAQPDARPCSQSLSSALQICHDGQWRDVPTCDGALLVNCGDFLQLLSCGRLTSPLHRVVLTPHERTSFVYFQYPAYDTPMPVGCDRLENLSLLQDQSSPSVTCGNAAASITSGLVFGDYIAQKWQQVARRGG